MAHVVPFRGIHYNTDRFGKDVTRFVAPPYDVIDREAERKLKEDRLNITYITLGDQQDGYATAAKRISRWLDDEVLVKDAADAFYIYEQTFMAPDGEPRVRSGIVGLVRLEDFSKGVVMPHENTIPKHKADRRALMSSVRGDVEQIFLLYDDPTGEVEDMLLRSRKRAEILRFVDAEGVHHRVLRLEDPAQVARVHELLASTRLLIADGHHRYETSLEYRDLRRKAEGPTGAERPYDFVMATLVSFDNPGLVIFPTHRVVSGVPRQALAGLVGALEEEFRVSRLKDEDALALAVDSSPDEAFGIWIPAEGVSALAIPKEFSGRGDALDRLSVSLLQERVLKKHLGFTTDMLDRKVNIDYVKGTDAARAAMDSGTHDACFFVKPPTVQQVMAVAETGKKMPHKSTYFFPKIWSGALVYLFDR